MNTLIETLQRRIAELEADNEELKRKNRRAQNAHLILMLEREGHLEKIAELRRKLAPALIP